MPILQATSGFEQYQAHCENHESECKEPCCLPCLPAHLIPSNEELDNEEANDNARPKEEIQEVQEDTQLRGAPLQTGFPTLHPVRDVPYIVEDEELNFGDASAELLHWHQRLGHVSFERLKRAAAQSIIPRRLQHDALLV